MESFNVVVDDGSIVNDNCANDDDIFPNRFEQDHKQEEVVKEDSEIAQSEIYADKEKERVPLSRVKLNHQATHVLGNIADPMKTRQQLREEVSNFCYVSLTEPKNVKDALLDADWIIAMHEELD